MPWKSITTPNGRSIGRNRGKNRVQSHSPFPPKGGEVVPIIGWGEVVKSSAKPIHHVKSTSRGHALSKRSVSNGEVRAVVSN